MAEPVKRDWRSKQREVRHTKEVRSEHIPKEVQEVMLEMAENISRLNLKIADLESRLLPIEALSRALAEEANKRAAA